MDRRSMVCSLAADMFSISTFSPISALIDFPAFPMLLAFWEGAIHIPRQSSHSIPYPLAGLPSADPWKYSFQSFASRTQRCFWARQSICTLHVRARNSHLRRLPSDTSEAPSLEFPEVSLHSFDIGIPLKTDTCEPVPQASYLFPIFWTYCNYGIPLF